MTNPQRRFIATNFNGKLASDGFIHIDLAPAEPVHEKDLQTPFELATRDGSHPPVLVRITDLARITFKELNNLPKCLTWCSHALDPIDLATRIATTHKNVTADTQCAIFFYQKIKTA